ncbi:MAG: hypothetical protein F6J97_07235 [Leptolyngbya sp. SIO4C1]|nr:hypothetical protein [Leptolyngbya sp. SIO4C1]
MTTQQPKPDPSHYDPHIIPAETAARASREGSHFAQVEHDSPASEHVHTRDGYTVDQEGLINNYAVEPPIYVNQPGDLAEQERALSQQRAAELAELQEDETGRLTIEHDWRHRGPGMV